MTSALLGELDRYLFGEGTHRRLYRHLGAHPVDGGTFFAVWAPNAREVAVIGDVGDWQVASRLEPEPASGIWAGVVDGYGAGHRYRYRVHGADGSVIDKSDPMATASEAPPGTASVIGDLDYRWGDDEWMAARQDGQAPDAPVSIYEVHLGSWRGRNEDGSFPSYDALAALSPAFTRDGTITAGNASQVSDGAVAGLVTTADAAARAGVTPLAEILGRCVIAGPDSTLHLRPAEAARRLLERHGLTPGDVALWEINEAFAGVVLASAESLEIDLEAVNVNGGAVALGHPLAASGLRLVLTLAYELRRRGGGLGVAAICGGGGQGEALLLRVPAAG